MRKFLSLFVSTMMLAAPAHADAAQVDALYAEPAGADVIRVGA